MISEEWHDISDLIDDVQELLDLGLFEDARKLLDKYETTYQDEYWEYHFLYSRVFSEMNRPREAIPCLIRGLRLERNNVDCLIGLFYAYAMMGRVKRGGRFLLKAEELNPDNDLVLSALIWYYAEMNEPEKAVERFERAQSVGSNNPETYRNAGIAFDRLGRFEEAEACYKGALMISPNFDEARDLYADHLIFTGKAGEAAKLYESALGESPKNIRLMSKLIYCLSQAGDFEKAEALARHSISMYPNSPLGYVDLAYVNLNTGDMDEAVNNADRAISVAPIDSEGYRVKAISCSERGDFDAADVFFEQALSFDPENSDIMRDYYRHLCAAGKHDKMKEVIEKVVKIEYPYCTEDYWFLADFYRDNKQNTTAFRYLRLAYESMPAEKELLPPMIEILMEEGHTKWSLPIFANYVRMSGWNDAMSGFMTNKQFRDRGTQEGMRFLRFTGERPIKYRKYIFDYYLYRFGLLLYTLTLAALAFPLGVLWGWTGVGAAAAFYVLSLAAVRVIRLIRFNRALARATRQTAGKG